MKQIIEEKGDNRWLADGTPHCHVRRDFEDTEYGWYSQKGLSPT
jgi:hypothetical protein